MGFTLISGRIARNLLLVALSGCASGAPKRAVLSYLHAEQQGGAALTDAWNALASADRAARPLGLYVADHASAGPVWHVMAQATQFDALRAKVDGDAAIVEIRATHPDPRALAELTPGISNARIAEADDPAALIRDAIRATLSSTEVPTIVETRPYALRLEGGEWHVWLGLAEQQAAIDAVAHATQLERAGRLAEAREAWTAVLKLPRDPSGVVDALANDATEAIGRLAAP